MLTLMWAIIIPPSSSSALLTAPLPLPLFMKNFLMSIWNVFQKANMYFYRTASQNKGLYFYRALKFWRPTIIHSLLIFRVCALSVNTVNAQRQHWASILTVSIEKLMLIMWATFSNNNEVVIYLGKTSCEFVVTLKQETTYSALFPAPFFSTVFTTKHSEESRERFQNYYACFMGCCVKSCPDTIVLFSDWLLCSPFLFLIGW